MKSSDNLNKALRDALKDHPEPLHDGQWDKLYRELHEKKSKRFFPWFGFWIIILVTGLTGFLTGYLLNSEDKNSNPIAVNSQVTVSPENAAVNPSSSAREELNQANVHVQSPESNQQSTSNVEPSIHLSPNTNTINNHPANTNKNQNTDFAHNEKQQPALNKLIKTDDHRSKPFKPADQVNSDNTANSNHPPEKNKSGVDLSLNTIKDLGKVDLKSDPINTELNENQNNLNVISNESKNDSMNDLTKLDNETNKTETNKSTKPPKKPRKDNPNPNPPGDSKWVFGLNIGLSTFNTKIGGYSAAGAVHKDVKDVNDNSLGNKNSKNFRLSVNYRLLKGLSLGFNTGLQYRTVTEVRNYNYKLTELPWRKDNNDIDFYIPLKDSQVFLTVNESRTSEFRYVTIPFTFSYNFKLSKTMELSTSLGANFNYLAKAKAQVLDLDKFDFSELSTHAGPRVNIGWMGSAMLSRHITGPWWIGFEFGLQRNRQKYKLEYSDYKSFNTFTNYNLCLRYKL